jgi:hypothetical protein
MGELRGMPGSRLEIESLAELRRPPKTVGTAARLTSQTVAQSPWFLLCSGPE